MRRMIAFGLTALLVGIAAAGLSQLSARADSAAQASAKPKVVGMLFYADWCNSCKVLEPKLQGVKQDFKGTGVLFSRFDLTDDFTKEQSALFASLLGWSNIYEDNQATGFMLLVDPKSKRVLGRLTKAQSPDELRAGIRQALVAATDVP